MNKEDAYREAVSCRNHTHSSDDYDWWQKQANWLGRKRRRKKKTQQEKIRNLLEKSVESMCCIGCTPTEKDCRNCILTAQTEYLYKHGVRVKE